VAYQEEVLEVIVHAYEVVNQVEVQEVALVVDLVVDLEAFYQLVHDMA
jgi:hypothetical protein